MTSVYNAEGHNVSCTIVEVVPNVVTQIKTADSDGYGSVQLAAGKAKAKNTSKAMNGHFAKAGTDAKRVVREFRDADIEAELGAAITANQVFAEGDVINAIGTSKGKGFQGVVKRHGFHGVGDATHGQHNRMRAPGSIGPSATPSKVYKGTRMAGRTGGTRVKIKNLKIFKILEDKNLVLVTGSIPGHRGSYVILEK